MDDTRKKEVKDIVLHFKDSKIGVSESLITEYCNLKKIEPLTPGQLSDATYQYTNDEVMRTLLPKMLALFVENMNYVGEFDAESAHTKESESRRDIKIAMVQLLEEYEVPYHWAQKLLDEFGAMVQGVFASAGQTATNKATEVLLHLAREKFGGEIHMGNVASYTRELFQKVEKEREATKEPTE